MVSNRKNAKKWKEHDEISKVANFEFRITVRFYT